MENNILKVRDLSVKFFVDDKWETVVDNISYDVKQKEILAIVGESGAGKSQSSMSLIGLLSKNGKAEGSVLLNGKELLGISHNELENVRGKDIAVIFQEPMTALNPVYTIGFQIVETIRTHENVTKEAKQRALELLKLVEMPEHKKRFNYYPSQLSGGQRQRAMIAQSLSLNPKLLIADEPTTALDVTIQAEILKLMKNLKNKINSSIILITHDMGVVADMADKICVMKDGKIVERGTVNEIFYKPKDKYTKMLLESVPKLGEIKHHKYVEKESFNKYENINQKKPILFAENVNVKFKKQNVKGNKNSFFRAVNDFSLTVNEHEIVGLVGESGSGKTTFGRAVVGLQPIQSGTLIFNELDMTNINRKNKGAIYKNISFIFQDPGSALNPKIPIGESISEPIFLSGIKGIDLDKHVGKLLDQVQLPHSYINKYPHELSGGEKQRVGVARALSIKPKLIVADEPTTALDVSIQAKILKMFRELHNEYGFACLFISHDIAVVESVVSKICIMHKGKLIESGSVSKILKNPTEKYTKQLLASVPIPDPIKQKEKSLYETKNF